MFYFKKLNFFTNDNECYKFDFRMGHNSKFGNLAEDIGFGGIRWEYMDDNNILRIYYTTKTNTHFTTFLLQVIMRCYNILII